MAYPKLDNIRLGHDVIYFTLDGLEGDAIIRNGLVRDPQVNHISATLSVGASSHIRQQLQEWLDGLADDKTTKSKT